MDNRKFDYGTYNETKKNYRQSYLVKRNYPHKYLILQVVATIVVWLLVLYCFRDVFWHIYLLSQDYDIREYFPLNILSSLLLYGIAVFIIITVWIGYNKLVFGGKDRRKSFSEWTKQQVKELYTINDKQYELLQKCDILQIAFNEKNKIQEVSGIMPNKIDKEGFYDCRIGNGSTLKS